MCDKTIKSVTLTLKE